jgi:hypothetical protein
MPLTDAKLRALKAREVAYKLSAGKVSSFSYP